MMDLSWYFLAFAFTIFFVWAVIKGVELYHPDPFFEDLIEKARHDSSVKYLDDYKASVDHSIDEAKMKNHIGVISNQSPRFLALKAQAYLIENDIDPEARVEKINGKITVVWSSHGIETMTHYG